MSSPLKLLKGPYRLRSGLDLALFLSYSGPLFPTNIPLLPTLGNILLLLTLSDFIMSTLEYLVPSLKHNIRRCEKKSHVGVIVITRRFQEVLDINVIVHTPLNIIVH